VKKRHIRIRGRGGEATEGLIEGWEREAKEKLRIRES
jgi:hypothetical protein